MRKLKARFTEWMKKYKHAWVLLYIFIYMPWFLYLEKHVTTDYHVIQTRLDQYIPFIEYFIVPYLLWFVFIAGAVLYFFFTDVPGYYKLTKFMFTGMTIFLIISTLFPNGQDLRPVVFERDNIFVDMVRMLYRADTSTNVFPSLHVFNSLSVCVAVYESSELKKHKYISCGVYLLAALIILATMFLKQHSILDVIGAFLMAYVLYQFVYAPEKKKVPGYARQKRQKRPAL
ncbi:phosphatase PAP2 family protein [Lachnoclostridium sp. An169]|uniref:phosphatase PAP2 family protein n=1 Tax=Lachnoclostridium sp. An169 TaxID=1965569 RepID=UPI000B390177|nr:phosphatase PAP2 family protein [Lachnoclostridium sp. An169]